MKLLKKIERHDVLKHWAKGEVYSTFFNPLFESERVSAMSYLCSGDHQLEKEAIKAVLEIKQGLIDSISTKINWYRALLEISKSDLDLSYTLQLPGWEKNTKGSYLVSDAARNIHCRPHLDTRVSNIYGSLRKKDVMMEGITLLAVDKIGPYVAIEGTGRLTSLYMLQQIDMIKVLSNNELEISLGLY
jgi:hypothetical protein